jgi:hypothetical protein
MPRMKAGPIFGLLGLLGLLGAAADRISISEYRKYHATPCGEGAPCPVGWVCHAEPQPVCRDGGMGLECGTLPDGRGFVPSTCRWPCGVSQDCGNGGLSCDSHGQCYETQPVVHVRRTLEEQGIFLLNDTGDDYWDAAADTFRAVLKAEPANARAKCYLEMALHHQRLGLDGGATCDTSRKR